MHGAEYSRTNDALAKSGSYANIALGSGIMVGSATAIAGASNALNEARDLAARVSDMVDRLCGTQPTEIAKGTNITGSGSIFGALRDDAERTQETIHRAQSQLSRLEREIP